jgi:lipid-A-disaccharide synthase
MHLLLAKALRKSGYVGKIVQVVCPAVWAWGKKKIPTLEKYFDHVFCLFPFEASLLKNGHYVGHPLVEMIAPPTEKREKLLTLFPGSRRGEIARNLPLQLAAARKFVQSHPEFQIAVSAADETIKEQCPGIYVFPPEDNYAMMRKSTLAIAKSGTVNLELALHEVPTVVTYEMNYLDYLLAKYVFQIHLPHYCIVNILLNQRLFPEHYGVRLSADTICRDLETLSHVPSDLRSLLGNKKSAEEIVEILFG